MKEGAWGNLRSTIPPISPASWTSIFTGLKPTKHSIWSFVKQREGSYHIRPISSKDIKGIPLWKVLSENGVRSVFVNIPFFYPPSEFNGVITTGLGTPSKNSNFAYPSGVKEKILEEFPEYNVDFNEDKILRSRDKSLILEEIFKTTKAHIDAFKYLYDSEKDSAEVFSVVLRSLDVVQHYFWNNEGVLLLFYRQADDFLRWCIETKEENDTLLVCSDHGFRHVDKKIYVNEIFKKWRFLSENNSKMDIKNKVLPSLESIHELLVYLGFRNLIWRIKRSTHLKKLFRIFPSDFSYIERIDWNNTDAYMEGGSSGIIRINLEGREPEGSVPKEDYDIVREKVIEKLSQFRDPDTGDRVFINVWKGEDIYGDVVEDCPDIVVYPKEGYTLSGGFSESGRIIEEETERNGDHALKGVFCTYSKSISNCMLDDINVWDVAAVVLGSKGLPIPDYLDGGVPNGLGELASSSEFLRFKTRNSIKRLMKKGYI